MTLADLREQAQRRPRATPQEERGPSASASEFSARTPSRLAYIRDLTAHHPPLAIPEDERRLPVYALGLSARVPNRLVSADINTVGDLVDTTPEQVLAIPNLGVKGLNEIDGTLAQRGLSLGQIAGPGQPSF